MLVSQILNSKNQKDVVTVTPSTTVSEAAQLLSDKRIGTVIVSRDGTTADGILSERDIVRALALSGTGCLTQNAEALMTSKLVTCQRDESVDSIMQKMTDGRFRHMPVVEDGKLIGVISIGDVVKARLTELSMEKNALEGMIMGY